MAMKNEIALLIVESYGLFSYVTFDLWSYILSVRIELMVCFIEPCGRKLIFDFRLNPIDYNFRDLGDIWGCSDNFPFRLVPEDSPALKEKD